MHLFFEAILCIILTQHVVEIKSGFKNRIALIRPQTINDHHNKNRLLFSFDSDCALSLRSVKHYIASLKQIYPCLADTNHKIYRSNGDFHTYLSLQYENHNLHNMNISCIDHLKINWRNFCLDFIDYELEFEQASDEIYCSTSTDYIRQYNDQYLWHLDYIDGYIDNQYTFINTSSEYRNVDIFVLDTAIQSTHKEFDGINYFNFDPSFNQKPLTFHGTHVAAIIVGENVGITQGSTSIPLYDYPICRLSRGCSFSYIEDALEKIIAFIESDYDPNYIKRVIINLSVQTKGLPSLKWIRYLEDLFAQIVDLGGVIVASAGNKAIDACYSYPSASDAVLSVAAYGANMEIYGNTGSCVDVYAPGIGIYSADVGDDNESYKMLKGTSMSAAFVTGLIANMLWVNNALTVDEIKAHLKASYHSYTVAANDVTECVANGCHLVHWECDAYAVELVDYDIGTFSTPQPTTEKPTVSPSNATPTESPTERNIVLGEVLLCCDAIKHKNKGVCRAIAGEIGCVTNPKCHWDENECLDSPCFAKRAPCDINEECCSNVCVRFKDRGHCI